ncbi:hypothetical protein NVP2044O_35 [Vibrio phage 2.044.O._10N.261.51.B8]|nr:hypothetical protein NVP2044O_35 [Vibrio phage 2.044.O._10N.261.51.B8]
MSKPNSNQPFTAEEQKCMDALVEAVRLFTLLDSTHPCHSKDFTDGIHKCQDVLIHKVVQRDYPETFPTHTRINIK